MATPETATVIALASFVAGVDGKEIVVLQGETRPTTDPVVKKFPQFFSRAKGLERIEQATAAPGEKR